MRGKTQMEVTFCIRADQAEKNAYDRYWRENDYGSLSDFTRCAANAAIMKNNKQLSSLMLNEKHIIERNIHLGRISTVLMELLTRATNDNSSENIDLETSLCAAISDIKMLRKKEA